jgi:multiple antibiotic resistance protein
VFSFNSANLYLVFDTFLLLLIGIGPKIALVPYVEITAGGGPRWRVLSIQQTRRVDQ